MLARRISRSIGERSWMRRRRGLGRSMRRSGGALVLSRVGGETLMLRCSLREEARVRFARLANSFHQELSEVSAALATLDGEASLDVRFALPGCSSRTEAPHSLNSNPSDRCRAAFRRWQRISNRSLPSNGSASSAKSRRMITPHSRTRSWRLSSSSLQVLWRR